MVMRNHVHEFKEGFVNFWIALGVLHPIPRWLSLSTVIIVFVMLLFCLTRFLANLKPCLYIMKKIAYISQKILKYLRTYCCKGVLSEDFELNKIQLTGKTFYEQIRPSIDELEYSDNLEDGGQGISLGRVHYKVKYNIDLKVLSVTVIECKDLPPADVNGASDPYVRIMVLPDTKKHFETLVIDDTLNPCYDQTFTFNNLPYNELINRTLCIRALDYDRFPNHDILGETLIPMIDIDFRQGEIDEWRILVPVYDMNKPGKLQKTLSDYGEICIGLQWKPVLKKLHVFVIECNNLKPVDKVDPKNKTKKGTPSLDTVCDGKPTGTADPYVKVTMFHNKKKVKTLKTRHIKQTLRPYYNKEFVFSLSPSQEPNCDIRFLVLDYDLFGRADVIGQCSIGANSYGPQLRQWTDMRLSPQAPVVAWHMLSAKPAASER